MPESERSGTAIVLAGGRSSRMGRPKALLPFDGVPIVTHLVATLKERFQEVVVVAAPDEPLPVLPVTLVHDEVPYQGPVGGLYYGLAAARGDVCFVTSCDAPFLSMPLVDHLLSLIDGYDAVVPRWAGRLQPLHAAYRTGVAARLEDQLRQRDLRASALLDRVRTRFVDDGEIRRFDLEGRSFFNLNTPDDYARALVEWDRARG